MKPEAILTAVEQYRTELAAIQGNPATRYFPVHDDAAVELIREFQKVGEQLWGHGSKDPA